MKYKIKDLCEVTSSRRIFASEYVKSGVPFYRGKEIIELSFGKKISTDLYITHKRFEEIAKSNNVPELGDILMTAVGTLGIPYFVDNPNFYFKDGNLIWFRGFSNKCVSKYLYYLLSTTKVKQNLLGNAIGSTQRAFTIDMVKSFEIELPDIETQQHIVDTIGSVDGLIEKTEQKLNKIRKLGELIFRENTNANLVNLTSIISFEKGKEIGSANYLEKQEENSIPYIRVGNLLNAEYDTFVINNNIAKCDVDDILIAFDGAPGRNNIGLKGCYSSGVQKVVCDKSDKGYIFFYLNSELCQNTIRVHSQGTTILHASKAIKELKIPVFTFEIKQKLNLLFNEMVSLVKQKEKLKQEKDLLLKKYFG